MEENNIPIEIGEPTGETPATEAPVPAEGHAFPAWMNSFALQALVVAVLAIAFYGNTFRNGAAFDDTVVILRNKYVLEGVRGIPAILTKDSYDSYFRQNNSDNPLSGGRYRPLSIITFAIEQQFFGAVSADAADSLAGVAPSFAMSSPHEQRLLHDMHIRHIFNVIWFTLSVIVLLYFLRYVVFKSYTFAAFLATLLFTIHPIHTEVVANVKSRDEIFSLLFISLTFILAFKYREHEKKWMQVLSVICFALALLSKEYAITLLLLLPLAFYLFNKDTVTKSIQETLPYLVLATFYLFVRYVIVHPLTNDTADTIQNNAYAYATGLQKIATEIATCLSYFRLLIFPHPLSSDYSYNTIPYKDFSDPAVWLSLLVNSGLIVAFVYFLRRRSILAFAIAFYLLNLLLISNLVFSIGATMGERLAYHSSVGFVIAVAYLLYHSAMRSKSGKIGLGMLMMLLVVLCGFTTIQRNADWKDTFTLSMHDIKVVPNSFLMNGNVAIMYMNKSAAEKSDSARNKDVDQALLYFNRAIAIDNRFLQGYIYKSSIFFGAKQADSFIVCVDKVKEINPAYPFLWEVYFNAGVLFYKKAEYTKALQAWQKSLAINPDYPKAKNAIDILYSANLLPK